jgi:hypothetical protein
MRIGPHINFSLIGHGAAGEHQRFILLGDERRYQAV